MTLECTFSKYRIFEKKTKSINRAKIQIRKIRIRNSDLKSEK